MPRQFNEWLAVFGFYVGGVGNGQAPSGEALCGYEMKNFEGIVGGREVVFIIRHEGPAIIRRNHFRRQEVFFRKGAFAGA